MKNINESGRSMVEMLGVLAIIGVLSIGGIAGYTMAMNKYEANEIINTIVQAAIHCRTKTPPASGNINMMTAVDASSKYFATLECTNVADGSVTFTYTNDTTETVSPNVKRMVCKGLGVSNDDACTSYTPVS